MICWAQLQLFKADEELERNNTSETLFGIGILQLSTLF